MKKWLLGGLVAIALLIAPRANAADWFISPAGSDDSSGVSAGTAVQTFAKAYTLVSSGDRIRCALSNTQYADNIVPTVPNVQVVGDSAAPNKVKVPGVSITGYNQDVSNTVINGVRVNGNVNVSQPWPPCASTANGFHVRNSVVNGDFLVTDAVGRIISNRIGTDSSGCHYRIKSYSCTVNGTVAVGNTIHARPAVGETHDGSNYLIAYWGEDVDNFFSRGTSSANTYQITTPAGYSPGKASMFRGLNGFTFTSDVFAIRDSTNSTDSYFGWLTRDAIIGNLWMGCTFSTTTLIAGKGGAMTHIISSGSIREGHDNVWRYNLFKSNIPQPSPIQVQWQFQNGDSFIYNTVACSTNAANGGFLVAGNAGTSVLDHNTFFNKSGGGAIRIIPSSCAFWGGTLVLTNNIFYTQSTGTTTSDFAAALFHKNTYAIYADYNLYAHYGGTGGSRSIMANQCGLAGQLKNVGPNSSRCASTGWDCNSLYGSPRFTDSTWANFTPSLRDTTGGVVASAAIGAGVGGSDIGSTPHSSSDATRPYVISDLYAASTTTSTVLLRWTATGDDSLTGTAFSYDIRLRNGTTITSGNFATSTPVSAGINPSVYGTIEGTVVTGLSPGTTYYFALKARDESGNPSAISNVIGVTTASEGGPGHIDP